MEKDFNDLLEKAKKTHKGLCKLKNAAVHCQAYELASKLRAIEKELYPESENAKKAHQDALIISNLLSLVDIKCDKNIAWTMFQAFEVFKQKGDQFSLEDATRIRHEASELFFNPLED